MKYLREMDFQEHYIFSNEGYEKIFNSILDPVVVYEVDDYKNFSRFIYLNDTFLNNYGFTWEELEKTGFSKISAEKEKLSSFISDIETGKRSLFETIHTTKNGRVFPVEVHSHFISLDDKKVIVSSIRDISVRKEYEEKLIELNKVQESILKIVSHDIRSPLNNIQGVLSLMETEDLQDTISTKKYLKLIEESCQHAENIVSELLATNNIESTDFNLTLERIDLRRFSLKLIQHYKIFAKSQKNLSLEYSLPNEYTPIIADEEKLTRVFDNIISNAVKFSFSESKIDFSVSLKNESAIFSIRDYGIGIPSKLRDKIFDKHTKAKRRGTDGENTIGLGMYITKTIVERHHGEIWFESEHEYGTTFYVKIPLKRDFPV